MPLGLFLLTFVSTTLVGALQVLTTDDGLQALLQPAVLGVGLRFSLPLCAILLCHEMGHYLMARRHGVPVSLPYFIPLPLPPIGTMGAIIGLRGEVRSRDALCDIAAAGPLAGLALALPLLAIGLWLSPVGPVAPGEMIEGQSLLYQGIKLLVKGRLLPGWSGGELLDVKLHPMAFAGWVGLFITMINLLPIGQLDGGRLAAAYFGGDHERRSRRLHRLLPLLALLAGGYAAWQAAHGLRAQPGWGIFWRGVNGGMLWLVWAGALLVMRRLSGGVWHPEVDPAPLSPGRRWLIRALFAVLVLIFMPYFGREAT